MPYKEKHAIKQKALLDTSQREHLHTSELSVKRGNNLAHGLGRTGRCRNDVLASTTSRTPILARRTIDRLLRGGHRVAIFERRCVSSGADCTHLSLNNIPRRHETLDDAKVVVDDLGERGKTVGGTRRVRDDSLRGLVAGMVHTNNVHGRIGRRSSDDDTGCMGGNTSCGILQIRMNFVKALHETC